MKKKNKIILLVTVLIAILLIITTAIALTSTRKDRENQTMDSKKNYEAKSKRYADLEDIPIDYNFVDMVGDGCYITMYTGVVYNASRLEEFTEDVERGIPNEIRVINWTVEGDLVILNLSYTKEKFVLKNDSRRDNFSAEKDRIIHTTEFDASKYKLVKEASKESTTNATHEMVYLIANEDTAEEPKEIYICTYIKKLASNNKFQIEFEKDESKGKNLILDSSKYGYSIYSYNGNVNIAINGEKMSLKDALNQDRITPDDIINKAKDDKENKIIYGDIYLDGGSGIYVYDNYTIIKLNKITGINSSYNKDLYIGPPSMEINDLKLY